ncbi:MFS transporter [Staphylococcus aureus]|uniref:MFS transporter n=1 Tax=Staphylococcus aureus TaxID=1280 RepID=UPI0018EE33E5|nr:MFS transporter [Staphylococcus aureus]MBJ6160463.1 MFS transporter [Staphylococcus aureus]
MKKLYKNRSFSNLLMSRILINAGDSLYYVSTTWIVLQWTQNPLLVGLTNTLLMIPMCISFLFGPLVDALPLKKTLFLTPLLQCLLLSLIASLNLIGYLNVYGLIILVAIAMFCTQIGYPAQSKAIPLLVKKDQLLDANSAMSLAYQGTEIAFFPLYSINSLIFLIACLFMLNVNIPNITNPARNNPSYLQNLKEGVLGIKNSLLLVVALVSGVINFGLGLLYTWIPLKADHLGGAYYYGLLMALFSIGLIVGSLITPYIKKINLGYGKLLILLNTISGLILILVNYIPRNFFIILFPVAFMTISITNISLASIQQKVIPEHLLARLTTIITSISAISLPMGSFIGGILIKNLGIDYTLVIGGALFIIASIIFFISTPYRSLPKIEKIEHYHIFGIQKIGNNH